MNITFKLITSWMGVFKQVSKVHTVNSVIELQDLVQEFLRNGTPFKVVGKYHSYNRAALSRNVIELGDNFNNIGLPSDDTAIVGAAVTVEDVMLKLMNRNRCLINSGNYRKQTLVGAILTGTHGFGDSASLVDHVEYANGINYKGELKVGVPAKDIKSLCAVVNVVVRHRELCRYMVINKVTTLCAYKPSKTSAFAVLPYSDSKNPVVIAAEYAEIPLDHHASHLPKKVSSKPSFWLKAFWKFDDWMPSIRKWIQRKTRSMVGARWTVVTDEHDIDSRYDPDPGADYPGKSFLRWCYRPSLTSYNIALFVEPEDLTCFIRSAIIEANKINPNLLRCFIGVRHLSDQSKVSWAGNGKGPVFAVDFYCSPRHAEDLIQLQRVLQACFDTRRHLGKTVEFDE